jgi:predicted nucleic acid-binding protein
MSGFLLDTNVISELIKPRPDAGVTTWIDATDEGLMYLSVLTLSEIRRGVATLPHARRRAALEAWLETDLSTRFEGRVLSIDDSVADRWGLLTAESLKRGTVISVIDGLLAATALQHNLTFVTRDTRNIAAAGIAVFNPWNQS